MTREDVVHIGREVGLPHWYDTKGLVNEKQLIKFANRIAEHERERLAKVFDELDKGIGFYDPHEPAEIIRSRGPKPPDSV
jgi:hypothetical protein